MSFATLMVHVEIEPKAEPDVESRMDARIRLAANLAERFASTLIGVSASVLPPYPAENGYFVTPEFFEQEHRDILAALKHTEAAFRSVAGTGGVKLEWRSAIDLPENYVVSESRCADLVIVGQARDGVDIARALDPGTAILKTGRPVLVAPAGVEALKAERILVAWKDSRESRRAVRDALPLLQAAASVAILEVCEDGGEDVARRRVDDVAQFLTRHRVAVTSAIAAGTPGTVAEQLIVSASAEDADLIVAGGYGHSRLGEWIFGGVTRDLLRSSPVCCLFAN
jgi:nucleotide-binding universal stress UspA family protein